ncbi:MAG TPA: PPOX class F420-dependent oxidoreductase [Ktedonobacterales bacterium]|nr:PPOX class F420-dependent oxidoreductase [Ktedonobacterales bacterium]
MEELTPSIQAFLSETRFAALATINKDGTPQQSTMWYALDGDTILMNTKAGRLKHRNLQRDPRASICVLDGYRWVTISGIVELNDDQAVAQADIRRLAIRYHGQEKGERQSREKFSQEHRVTVRLKIEKVTSEDV